MFRHRRDLYNRLEIAMDKYVVLCFVFKYEILMCFLLNAAWDIMDGSVFYVHSAKVDSISSGGRLIW